MSSAASVQGSENRHVHSVNSWNPVESQLRHYRSRGVVSCRKAVLAAKTLQQQ